MSMSELAVFEEKGEVIAFESPWNALCFLPEKARFKPVGSRQEILSPAECYYILEESGVDAVCWPDNLLVKFLVKNKNVLKRIYRQYYSANDDYMFPVGKLEELWIRDKYTSADLEIVGKTQIKDLIPGLTDQAS
jgi:hypothetical protein